MCLQQKNILFHIHFASLHTTYWAIHSVHLLWVKQKLISHRVSDIVWEVVSKCIKYLYQIVSEKRNDRLYIFFIYTLITNYQRTADSG